MKHIHLPTITMLLLGAALWLALSTMHIAHVIGRGSSSTFIWVIALLVIEVFVHIILMVGIVKQWKYISWYLTIFLVINSILSVTDELGTWDIISLGIGLLTLIVYWIIEFKSSKNMKGHI